LYTGDARVYTAAILESTRWVHVAGARASRPATGDRHGDERGSSASDELTAPPSTTSPLAFHASKAAGSCQELA
jgi:hypothetical protein